MSAPPPAWPDGPATWRAAVVRAKDGAAIARTVDGLRAEWGADGTLVTVLVVDPDGDPAIGRRASLAVALVGVVLLLAGAAIGDAPVLVLLGVGGLVGGYLAHQRDFRPARAIRRPDVAGLLLEQHQALGRIARAHDPDGRGVLSDALRRDHDLLWALSGELSPAQENVAYDRHDAIYDHACAADRALAAQDPGVTYAEAIDALREYVSALDAARDELSHSDQNR